MANRSLQSICGVPIKRPSEFKIERYNVTNIDRLANGDACGDLIAKSVNFILPIIPSHQMIWIKF